MKGSETTSSNERQPAEENHPFDAAYYRGMVVEHLLIVALLAIFYLSGASRRLSDGAMYLLRGRWWLAHAVYLAVSFLGLAVLLFPFHAARARRLTDALRAQGFASVSQWVLHARAVGSQGVLAFAFFYALYVLLRWFPIQWWMLVATAYAAVAVWMPMGMRHYILPRIYRLEALPEALLESRLMNLAQAVGVSIKRVGMWAADDDMEAEWPPVMIGAGRIMGLHPSVVENMEPEAVLALAARELGAVRQRHGPIRAGAAAACALAAFGAVHLGAQYLVRLGIPAPASGVRDIASFPLLALLVLIASAMAQTVYRAILRAQVYAADAFAERLVGSDGLVDALRELYPEPTPLPQWVEWLFLSQPSVRRRLQRLQTACRFPPDDGAQ